MTAHVTDGVKGRKQPQKAGDQGKQHTQRLNAEQQAQAGQDLEAFPWEEAGGRVARVICDIVLPGDGEEIAGEVAGAVAAYDVALRQHPKGEDAAAAHLGSARALMALHQPTLAYQHVYEAERAGPTPDQEAEAHALLERLKRIAVLPPGEALPEAPNPALTVDRQKQGAAMESLGIVTERPVIAMMPGVERWGISMPAIFAGRAGAAPVAPGRPSIVMKSGSADRATFRSASTLPAAKILLGMMSVTAFLVPSTTPVASEV